MFFKFSEIKIPLYVQKWDPSLLPIIEKQAMQNKIDIRNLCALIQTESSGRTGAVRYETNYPWIKDVNGIAKIWGLTAETVTILLKTSWGLCQVMGAYAIELGLPKYKVMPHELCRPEYGILFGCLAWNHKKDQFKLSSPLDIYAAYNGGHVDMVNGQYKNKRHVDRFNVNLLAFEIATPLH